MKQLWLFTFNDFVVICSLFNNSFMLFIGGADNVPVLTIVLAFYSCYEDLFSLNVELAVYLGLI